MRKAPIESLFYVHFLFQQSTIFLTRLLNLVFWLWFSCSIWWGGGGGGGPYLKHAVLVIAALVFTLFSRFLWDSKRFPLNVCCFPGSSPDQRSDERTPCSNVTDEAVCGNLGRVVLGAQHSVVRVSASADNVSASIWPVHAKEVGSTESAPPSSASGAVNT